MRVLDQGARVLFVLALAMNVFSANAETWLVPEEIPTIEEALLLAQPYDTILVSPGEYDIDDPLTLDTPFLVLLSEEKRGARLVTTFNAPTFTVEADSITVQDFWIAHLATERAFWIKSSVSKTQIRGNRIFGAGLAFALEDQGTQTCVVGNEIEDCISPFWTHGGGEGVFEANDVKECSLNLSIYAPFEIRNNSITGIRAGVDIGQSIHGGGIEVRNVTGWVRLEGNYISDNWASGRQPPGPSDWDAEGGGIWIGSCDSVLVFRNEIAANQATYGGGLYCESSNVDIRENLIHANYDSTNYDENPVRGSGGGLFIRDCSGILAANTIVENIAFIEGGGVFIEGPRTPEFLGTIVASNWTTGESGGVFCSSSSAVIECNDVWNNAMANYGGDCPDPTGLNGNISADPMFCYPDTGNFRLLPESPCTEENSPLGCGLIGAYQVGCDVATVSEEVLNQPIPQIRVFPNPAQRGSRVSLVLDQTKHLQSLGIFDVVGRRIWSVALGDASNRGRFVWDGRSESGHNVRTGLYFVRMSTGAGEARAKLLIIE